jgi:lauroyl/myristoyl acyltransferase
MPNASKFLHLLAYGLYLACTAVARWLPLKLVFVTGQALGFLGFLLLFRRRRVAIGNTMLALNMTREEARGLARRHFVNLGANMLSALKISTMRDRDITKCLTTEIPPEMEKIAKAGGEKKGWVAMISHMGNWEILSHLSPILPYYKYGAIYHKLANDYVDRHFKESRARSGVTLFDRREGYLKCGQFIRSGGVVGVLVDQYAGLPGTWMPFFQRLTSTSTLAALLAQRCDTVIVPISIKTTGIAHWHVKISMPLERDEDPEVQTARVNRELEKQIRASPEDWLWSHNRWKTPRLVFLFSRSARRVFYPADFDRTTLIPYRMLIRVADGLEEAQAAAPAVLAIKRGRPDAHVTVVTPDESGGFWKSAAGVDDVLTVGAGESAREIGRKIKNKGTFEVGILFSNTRKAALELYHGEVPYRIGPPHRFFLNDWRNAPGLKDTPERGAERYRRIAQDIGAAVD